MSMGLKTTLLAAQLQFWGFKLVTFAKQCCWQHFTDRLDTVVAIAGHYSIDCDHAQQVGH